MYGGGGGTARKGSGVLLDHPPQGGTTGQVRHTGPVPMATIKVGSGPYYTGTGPVATVLQAVQKLIKHPRAVETVRQGTQGFGAGTHGLLVAQGGGGLDGCGHRRTVGGRCISEALLHILVPDT